MPKSSTSRVLLYGPYAAPLLRIGERTTCLCRDCDVVITGWFDAPIPWPRCRALGTRRDDEGALDAGH